MGADVDRAVGQRTRLAGQTKTTVTLTLRQTRRLGPQVFQFAVDQLHAAGTASARAALVGQADASAQGRPKQTVSGLAGEGLVSILQPNRK